MAQRKGREIDRATFLYFLLQQGSKSVGGHEHTTPSGKARTLAASIYPLALCNQILLGARDQLQAELKPTNNYLANLMKSSLPVYDLSEKREYGEVRPNVDGPSDMDDWDQSGKDLFISNGLDVGF